MRPSDYIKAAILKYDSEGGGTAASADASGVTASKVQLRDANGNLLAEYEKKSDIFKQTIKTPNKGLQLLGAVGGIAFLVVVGGVLSRGTPISGGWFSNSTITEPTPAPAPSESSDSQSKSLFAPKEQKIVGVDNGGGLSACPGISPGRFQKHYLEQGWSVINSSTSTSRISTGSINDIQQYLECSKTTYVLER